MQREITILSFALYLILWADNTSAKIKKLIVPKISNRKCFMNCPPIENPICVEVKSKKPGIENPLHIVMMNTCEMELMKCHKGMQGVIVSMKMCDSKHMKISKKIQSLKRTKRNTLRVTAKDGENTDTVKRNKKLSVITAAEDDETENSNTEAVNSEDTESVIIQVNKKLSSDTAAEDGKSDQVSAVEVEDNTSQGTDDDNGNSDQVTADESGEADRVSEIEDDKIDQVSAAEDSNTDQVATAENSEVDQVITAKDSKIGQVGVKEVSKIDQVTAVEDSKSDELIAAGDSKTDKYTEADDKVDQITAVEDRQTDQITAAEDGNTDQVTAAENGNDSVTGKEITNREKQRVIDAPGADEAGYDYDVTDAEDLSNVDMDEYKSDCPKTCPARDVMVCAKCKDGVYRTFMSVCHMRMFTCQHPEEQLELVSRYPCVLSAPYLANMRSAQGRLKEAGDEDKILKYIYCKQKENNLSGNAEGSLLSAKPC